MKVRGVAGTSAAVEFNGHYTLIDVTDRDKFAQLILSDAGLEKLCEALLAIRRARRTARSAGEASP